MPVFTEARHAGEFILTEANGKRSRENVTIAAEQTVLAGAPLALLALASGVTATAAADAGNTGNGTIAMEDPAVNSRVKNGDYIVIMTAATAFKVEDPNGVEIGVGATGTAFNKEVKFTVTVGGTPMVAGDRFTITVGVENPGDYQAVPYDPAGTDGSEKAAAVAIYPATTGVGETIKIAALVRDCEVNGKVLSWPEGISDADKAAAIADLAAAGIIVR